MSRYAVLFCALVVTLSGCTKKDEASAPTADPAAAAKAAGPQEVNLAIWANYLSPEMQERFTKETGIKLKISNFSSNEELLAKIQAGASGYDVAVPSDYMVGVLAKLNLLQALNTEKVPNRGDLDPAFMKQGFDPENKFSLPYAWTTAGLAVNTELYKGNVKGWKDLFAKKDLAGKVSLLDDVREVTAAALKANGYSVNTIDPKELAKAEATLKDARKKVKMYSSDTIDALVNKEVAVAHTYSSDALQAAVKSGGKIVYVIPEEGGTRAIDNLVILKSAKNVEAAHKLVNFLLSHDANLAFVTTIMGGSVLKSTKEALPANLQSNPALFPSAAVLSKLEGIQDVGDATKLYDRLWTEVKSE
ncbi:MAG: spermidine/putrescine ABC transporter substrate-binding protein [Bdellovibrionota bacterium]